MSGEKREALVPPVKADEPADEKKTEAPRPKKDDNKAADEMSEEDRKKKEELELLVERVQDSDANLQKVALLSMKEEIRTSTTSMTSVPKALKFLRPHYSALKDFFENMMDGENKLVLADILSVLGMTMAGEDTRESLKYKLLAPPSGLLDWGHEYIRNLSGEIGAEYHSRVTEQKDCQDLISLVDQIVPFNMQHNSEPDAVDLLMEVDRLHTLPQHANETNYGRVSNYLLRCADYAADQDELAKVLKVTLEIYLQLGKYADALRVALRTDDPATISNVVNSCQDRLVKKQLCFILARHRIRIEELMEADSGSAMKDDNEDASEEFANIMGNVNLSEHFAHLASELDVVDAKTPEDIYKTHLESGGPGGFGGGPGAVDSAKQNLASTFVNAFVNAGFCKDLLMTPEGSKWLFKNKDHGMMSAAASMGMIMMWNCDSGFSEVDKFSFSSENYIKAGALLATGMVSANVTSDVDPAKVLLEEHLDSSDGMMRLAAVLGMSLSYAGSAREDILESLSPILNDTGNSIELVSMAALSLGLVFVGTCNNDVCEYIMQAFFERSETELNDSMARFLCLALGLLFLGKQENADATLEALKVVPHPIRDYCSMVVETCSYAGTCNVLKIQRLLSVCGEHPSEAGTGTDSAAGEAGADASASTSETGGGATAAGTGAGGSAAAASISSVSSSTSSSGGSSSAAAAEDDGTPTVQSVATLGLGMIAMGEEIGSDMLLRTVDHLLQYGELPVRRAVPLCLGLISISHPQVTVTDTLSKLSHDMDPEVSQTAILALGLIGAGTNNSRIAQLLRQLASYYAKEANHLFLVRISQGLLHMAKGLMSLSPYHSDRMLLSPASLGGLLVVLHAFLDLNNTILSKRHYLLYYLCCSMYPRMLITLDADLKPLPVSVRVGQAVDIAGQAGKPKTITGFQTHTTPVLLGHGDRAELATDQYLPLTSVLEGFVILVPNPDSTHTEES